ncbi:MAG: polyprenyl synthetase family protein [Anaerolineae bacterium]
MDDRSSSQRRREAGWLKQKLSQYKAVTIDELVRRVPGQLRKDTLRDLILDYPLRPGKGLRPALCMNTCEAFGGRWQDALNSAVAIELFHNAFLVHDDVEDGSLMRRGAPTLHEKHGVPLAVNAGDAMNVLTLRALLDNFSVLGVELAQRIFEEIEWMVLQSVEGQSIELGWVAASRWDLGERDYYLMSLKKTGWYTCISPCRIGALIAGADLRTINAFNSFGYHLGIAFQIQDDILNLKGQQQLYGKESAGDLWEGKRTVILIHLLNQASRNGRDRLISILNKPRAEKEPDEVAWVLDEMDQYGSVAYAKDVAWRFALRARDILKRRLQCMPESEAKAFLRAIVDYVVYREL